MATEKSDSADDQIKLLEKQLAEQRKIRDLEEQLAEMRNPKDQTESQSAQPASEEASEEQADELHKMPDIRVIQRENPADPPKADTGPGEKGVLGVLRRTIETVAGGQRDREQTPVADESLPPERQGTSVSADSASPALASLEQKLDAIAESISAASGDDETVTQAALEQVMHEVVTAVQRHAEATEQQAQEIRSELHTIGAQTGMLARQMAELAAREEQETEEPEAAAPGNLEKAICGESLAADSSLGSARHELIVGFLDSEQGAMGLVGQLLLFQAAPADRMPHLLRDIGEAYYRWRPQTTHSSDPFQQAMIRWLAQACEQNGSANRIELVRPGDRYDAARHHAKSRGLEVTDVNGWVVLRDNGKVYTKAAVAVK